jgi:hypothetical protein
MSVSLNRYTYYNRYYLKLQHPMIIKSEKYSKEN